MNRETFFAAVKQRTAGLFPGALSQAQVDALGAILDECGREGLSRSETAYVLATAYHEAGAALLPVAENLNYSAKRIREVWPSRFASADAAAPYARNPERLANKVYGGRNGNGPEASGDGWRYRGRGFVQITGRANYRRMSQIHGADLIGDPDRALEIGLAAAILVRGMKAGSFTGRKLADFMRPAAADYDNARAIVNDDVRANGAKIAGHARAFEAAIAAGGWGVAAPASEPPEPPRMPDDPGPEAGPTETPTETTMNNAMPTQFLRIALQWGAAALVTRGLLAEANTELFVGSVTGLATLGWWAVANWRR